MKKLDEAINRIKILECPAGELENRVAGILEDYGVAGGSLEKMDGDNNLTGDETQAYRVDIPGEGRPLVVLAKSGYDDYVAKVVDVYRT